jgi:hypothetical protein
VAARLEPDVANSFSSSRDRRTVTSNPCQTVNQQEWSPNKGSVFSPPVLRHLPLRFPPRVEFCLTVEHFGEPRGRFLSNTDHGSVIGHCNPH